MQCTVPFARIRLDVIVSGIAIIVLSNPFKTPTLQRSSGSVSVVEEGATGEGEVRLRKSKKRRKRSSMIFISEEKERTNTLDCNKRLSKKQEFRSDTNLSDPSENSTPLTSTNSRSLPTITGLALSVANGGEDGETARSRRDSKSVSICIPTDRTPDRRSKGVISLLFRTKLGSKSEEAKPPAEPAGDKSSSHF
ncbi:hypothetical protein SKAU_G00368780 [Synaphobranchus kaupii]|uniref:Uncharacterized protein n=1 Tax=Synaphobranchus kaupii TaxID=118154 RepID=A0A9Q1EFM3_SYNKA|nr:hypothetical protein SKAU_G00368780 [Synaphobranchus kaupii]